jgi:hypothetical protein
VESYAPLNSAAEVYRSLWCEIDERLAVNGAPRQRPGVAAATRAPSAEDALAAAPTEPPATDADLVGSPWSGGAG